MILVTKLIEMKMIDFHEIVVLFDLDVDMLWSIILHYLIIHTTYLTPENFESSDDKHNASNEEAEEDYATESAEWDLPRLKVF